MIIYFSSHLSAWSIFLPLVEKIRLGPLGAHQLLAYEI